MDRVGAMLMCSVNGDCGVGEVRYGVFSGTLVRAEVLRNVPVSIRGSSIDMYKKHGIGKLIDIKSITLSDLINEYTIDGNDAMLKMDCEGCEFDVILNDYEHVKLFNEVVFEYHAYAVHRPIAELINTMSNDFNRQTINEGFFRKFFNDYSRDQLGLIRCVKRS